MKQKFRTRSLGGSLLVLKGLNDCLTIERDNNSKLKIVSVEGSWTPSEIKEGAKLWKGSDSQRR